ncbi:hypothetical protein [Promicromonospora panici]|uniref:hypothetical protein n=1 Tax=Promicromonospora panici TaxID=2219658 RepID=UPI00101D5B42|nr:hypothetical protein [Promicromonospora panici]
MQLAVPEGLEEEGEGYWATGTGQDDADLAVTPTDAPIEKQRPGQTSVPVDGATSVLVVIVKDHDMGPDFFVGVAEIVLESGEATGVRGYAGRRRARCSSHISMHAPGASPGSLVSADTVGASSWMSATRL